MTLWSEFLSGYFNGQNHSIQNGVSVMFRNVPLTFQQNAVPQPVQQPGFDGAEIGVVMADPGQLVQLQIGGQYSGYQVVMLEFFIRAFVKKVNSDGSNSDYLCRNVSDCLYGLLADRGASVPLQLKGMQRIRPFSPAIVACNYYSLRRIRCRVRYNFATPASNGTPSGILGGD